MSFSHCFQLSRNFQHITCVLGGHAWAFTEEYYNAKQAPGAGKSGAVKTGLTTPAITVPSSLVVKTSYYCWSDFSKNLSNLESLSLGSKLYSIHCMVLL